MKQLSKRTLDELRESGLQLPGKEYFQYPEKVLQFGTGVLLRGLVDYFIDKANKQGIFKGRVVVVKSTGQDTASFSDQDGLYTICVRGLEDGRQVEENILNASISRVIAAGSHWNEILDCASNPEMELIISNTTEVGIVLTQDDIQASPPKSFPGKLLAFLYRRFKTFTGDPEKGMVIIPTELLPDNGKKLLSILLELAVQNKLEDSFLEWLKNSNEFCNSLVDRIVPGKLPAEQEARIEELLGYRDELMLMAETYRLWAIETSNAKALKLLSFSKVDPGMVIAPDIHIFRELKLRLLNGSHTLSCGLAHLAGFITVRQAMADAGFSSYEETLMKQEIAPVIVEKELSLPTALDFADRVLNRYRNPFLEHKWLSITMQYASKMRMRDLPLLLNYYRLYGRSPRYMTLGWAAHILFMKCRKQADGQYYGEIGAKKYLVNDNQAASYSQKWENRVTVVQSVLSDSELWGSDLTQLPGFRDAVANNLEQLERLGAAEMIQKIRE